MAAEINELLERGVIRCRELTDTADEAMGAVDTAAEQARELSERIEQEGREATRHLRGLVMLLEKAADALAESRGEAQGALERLAGQAAGLQSEAGALLARVKVCTAPLDEQRSRLDDSLDAQVGEAQADVTGLAGPAQEVEAEAVRRLHEAGQAIAAFRAAIEDAREELVRKRDAWSDALGRLEATAQEQAIALVAALQAMLRRQASAIVNAANVMVDRHNDTMEAIEQEFAEQAPDDLAGALEPVRAAVESLGESADACEGVLTARVTELEAAMEAQGAVLDGLRAAFDSGPGLA